MKKPQGKRNGCGLAGGLLLGIELITGRWPALGRTRAGDESGQQPRISVRVYNIAQVADKTLTRAENLATEIFRTAGVELSWTNCQLPEDARCADLLDRTHLGMRLLPDIGPALRSSDTTMGYALGDMATVSLRRVEEGAAKSGALLQVVLAPVLAHEIGHLLLGSEGHSPTGIMRAHWQTTDYHPHPANARALLFTPAQAQSIRNEVKKRAQMKAGTGIVTATAPI